MKWERHARDHAADVLDIYTLDARKRIQQHIYRLDTGEVDRQLVNRSTFPALENIDSDKVAADFRDHCRQTRERARAVCQPHAHHVTRHSATLRTACERTAVAQKVRF